MGNTTASQPSVGGLLGTVTEFGSSSECATVTAKESDPHFDSLSKASRRHPRRRWGINYTAAMGSATRTLGRLVQAGPPQLCCHHPGHSSEPC